MKGKKKAKLKAAIIGGSGYVGGELVRLLLYHKNVKVIEVTSRQHEGQYVSEVHTNLYKQTQLKFSNKPVKEIAKNADVMFFAMPHGVSMELMPEIIKAAKKPKIIDLSSDYRLKEIKLYEQYYKKSHKTPKFFSKFVYGLPEINQNEIKKSDFVACPGCFPTGAILALAPLADKGMLCNTVVIDSKTGSSGSGAEPSITTHHPERAHDFRAYKMLSHQHTPEIKQELMKLNSKTSKEDFEIAFVPHSAPMVRGIFTTAYVCLKKPMEEKSLKGLYLKYYKNKPFIRFVENSPRNAVVIGTNFCDIGFACNGKNVVIMSAIDNLVKGAAGQAVQNMNIMFGFDEKEALAFPGMHP